MLITHTHPRPDLNDGQPHDDKRKHVTALHLHLELQRIRMRSPLHTAKVRK